jgi:hypothetical protein
LALLLSVTPLDFIIVVAVLVKPTAVFVHAACGACIEAMSSNRRSWGYGWLRWYKLPFVVVVVRLSYRRQGGRGRSQARCGVADTLFSQWTIVDESHIVVYQESHSVLGSP